MTTFLRDLSIRKKLMLGFGLVLVIALVQSLLSVHRLSQVNDKSTEIARNWLPSVKDLGDMYASMTEYRVARMQLMLTDNEEAVNNVEKNLKAAHSRFEQGREAYEKLISSAEEKALFDEFSQHWKAYEGLQTELMTLVRNVDMSGARMLLVGPGAKSYASANEALTKLIDLNTAGSRRASDQADALYGQSRNLVLAGLAVMIVLGLSVGWLVSRALSEAAAQAVRDADRIAEGDLSQSIHVSGRDEVGGLQDSLGKMQQR